MGFMSWLIRIENCGKYGFEFVLNINPGLPIPHRYVPDNTVPPGYGYGRARNGRSAPFAPVRRYEKDHVRTDAHFSVPYPDPNGGLLDGTTIFKTVSWRNLNVQKSVSLNIRIDLSNFKFDRQEANER